MRSEDPSAVTPGLGFASPAVTLVRGPAGQLGELPWQRLRPRETSRRLTWFLVTGTASGVRSAHRVCAAVRRAAMGVGGGPTRGRFAT